MTNSEKQYLTKLAKHGHPFEYIRKLVNCSDSTIKRYIETFGVTSKPVEPKKYKVVYFQTDYQEENYSQEDLINNKRKAGTLYLALDPSESWGDDWNDNPSSCNSGEPYDNRKDGLISIDLYYGKPIDWGNL